MQTEACQMATTQLINTKNLNTQPQEIQAALAHISDCTHCQTNLLHLTEALQTDIEDELTCGECEERLPEYLTALDEGQGDETRWQPIAFHIKICPHCTNVFQELAELMELALEVDDTPTAAYPTPDLSFLSKSNIAPTETPQITPWLDEMGRLMIQFSAELLQSLQPPPLAPTGLKKQANAQVLLKYDWQTDEGDIEVAITAEAVSDDPDHCTVLVVVNIPNRGGWPNLADTAVALKRNDTILEAGSTDAFGHIIFEGVAIQDLSQLLFEITPTV